MIVLACGSASVRRRWRLGLRPGVDVTEVADAARLRRDVVALKPSVLVVDLALPRLGGLATVARLQRQSPATRMILVTPAPRDAEGVAALKAGARGYCHRDIDPALLDKAVEVVQKGEIWAGRALIARLLDDLAAITERRERGPAPPLEGLEQLTLREREIALLVAAGASNKEIAEQVGVKEKTVKAHLTAIFRKLDVPDRLRLAVRLNTSRRPDPGPLD
jgi:DNA-binding NarL/FixJ family response regulator